MAPDALHLTALYRADRRAILVAFSLYGTVLEAAARRLRKRCVSAASRDLHHNATDMRLYNV